MVAIDTNILVRFFTGDDANLYAEAKKLIEQAETGSLLLDRIILAELGYVLHSGYPYAKHDIAKIYKSLLSDQRFSVVDRELVELTANLFETEKPLSFEDCWLLALKRSNKVSDVLTFNVGLQKRLA